MLKSSYSFKVLAFLIFFLTNFKPFFSVEYLVHTNDIYRTMWFSVNDTKPEKTCRNKPKQTYM